MFIVYLIALSNQSINSDIDTALAAEDVASVYTLGVGFDSKSVDMYSRRRGVVVQRHKVIYDFYGAYRKICSLFLFVVWKCHIRVFLIFVLHFQTISLRPLVKAFLE